jgi:subtilisin family serine protease
MKPTRHRITWVLLVSVGLLVSVLAWRAFSHRPTTAHATGLASYRTPSRTGFPGVTAAAGWPSGTLARVAGQPHPFGVAPRNKYRMAGAGRFAFLKGAQRLVSRDDRPNAAGQFRRVSLYRTNMKYPFVRLEETLQRLPNGTEIVLEGNATAADHVVMRAQSGETAQDVANLAAQDGDTVLKPMHTPGYYLIQISALNLDGVPIAVQTLSRTSAVARYVEPDQIATSATTPDDPDFSQQWSMNNTGQTGGIAHADISAVSAWSVIHSSPNVIVAVVDTGIDFNHPDLAPNIWTNPHPGSLAGYTGDLHGWNFYSDNNTPQDDNFHGTHVSGTIAAIGNNDVGVAGVTWNVQLMPLKFLASDGTGYTSDAVDAITYATAMGARIISNSWGGITYSQSLEDVIAAANTAGVLFVVAAGNDGVDTDETPTYPSCFTNANIISVAATDDDDQLASFSNYGTATVQIAAPGVGILSTFPTVATAAMNAEGLPPFYGQISGTSMATPLVSGAAALALAQNPSLTVAQLKSQIIQRADSLTQLAGIVQSAGRLDLYNVVNTNWSAGAASLQLSSTTFDDTEGNDDGTANPGEIIHLTPVLYNAGGTAANNVTVQMTSDQTTATMLTTSLSAGTLLPQQTVTLSSPFRIQLSPSVAVGTTLTFNVVISATGLPDVHGTATVLVQASRGYSTAMASFACGEIKADPGRNLVYATDITNSRMLAIDTDSGQLAAVANLDVTSGAGQMAVSLDDSKLYVSLPQAQEIQVFSLPGLSPMGTLPVNFTPYSLACGVGGRLYAADFGNAGSYLHEVNTSNGQIVQNFGSASSSPLLLRTSSDGSKLYGAEAGVSGYTDAVEYTISGVTATFVNQWEFDNENLIDFAVDDANNRLYLMNGGIYGVNVLDLTTGSYSTVWPLNSAYAVGVALLPGGSVVYGASGESPSVIVEYDRTSGTALRTYTDGAGSYGLPIQDRGIAETPNGNVLYVESQAGGGTAVFGLIGGTTLNVTSPPANATGSAFALTSVGFSDPNGNGDGVPNPGEIIDLAPTITNIGPNTQTNVGISLTCGSNATLMSLSSQTIASLAAGQAGATPTPFQVQLASSAVVGTSVSFTFTVTPASGTPQSFTYTLVVQPAKMINAATTPLQLGEILADPQRDVVYIIDKTDMEVLAFDTDAGHITTTGPIGGAQAISWEGQDSGGMAESVDGTHLYVALPQTNMIQELSLPGLTSVAKWTYSFAPVSLACDATGRLYCSTTDSTQKLVQINGSTGAVISHSGAAFVSALASQGSGTILHRNSAGTELYASLSSSPQSQIYRYSTSGANAPAQLAALNFAGTIIDFTVDETRSAFYVAAGNGEVNVIPFSGTATGWSVPNQSYGGVAISVLPAASGVLAADGSFEGGINFFAPANGQDVFTYQLNDEYYAVKPRGMTTTPNGRTLYISTDNAPDGAGTIDGYLYKVGLIGGSINLQVPGQSAIGLESLAVTDPAPGSNDGYVHPGQTIQLAPVFQNFLNFGITGVSVQLTTTDTLATVNAPATTNNGNVASFATFSPTFNMAVSASATDGHPIPLNFVVSYDNGAQQVIPYTLYVSAAAQTQTAVNFQVGEMLSDPNHDLAYVVDLTNQRLLEINTDTGTVAKAMRLASSPGLGQLALSADGSHLYVALTTAQQIQVVSLPDLQQSDLIEVAAQPFSLAAGSDEMLYVSGTSTTGFGSNTRLLGQINPATGETIATFGNDGGSMLRASDDYSSFFTGPTGEDGFVYVDGYEMNPPGVPTSQYSISLDIDNLSDLEFDHTYQRLYSAQGGIYGLGVTDIATGITTTWPASNAYANYGDALCFLPNGNFVYSGNYQVIRRYNRVDGTPLADYPVSNAGYNLLPRGMAISANGHILYAMSQFIGNGGFGGYLYQLGLIGGANLSINSPALAPTIYAGGDQSITVSQSATLQATAVGSSANLPITWQVVSGPSGASLGANSASFAAPGIYQLRATVTDGALTASDQFNVTVAPNPATVSVAASVPAAVPGIANGQFLFNRTGLPSGALTVTYIISGTARSGTDYVALPGSAIIPDGASSVTVPVVPAAAPTPGATVMVSVTSTASYTVGLSPQAVVSLQPASFQAWVNGELPGASAALQAPSADPKNDGVANLVKYALDINPSLPAAQGLPLSSYIAPGDGNDYLTLRFTERPNATDVVYTVEVSSDLTNWTSGTGATLQVSSTPNTDGTATVVIRDMTPAGTGPRFIRLEVSQP